MQSSHQCLQFLSMGVKQLDYMGIQVNPFVLLQDIKYPFEVERVWSAGMLPVIFGIIPSGGEGVKYICDSHYSGGKGYVFAA